MLRKRIGGKGPIAFRWPGVPGEDSALARLQSVAAGAGLALQWGRKVPRVRPHGFLTGGVDGFARVVEGLLRAAR
jgi:hypothetical protein